MYFTTGIFVNNINHIVLLLITIIINS